MDIKLSVHAHDMLKERNIPEEWVWRTIREPDWQNVGKDTMFITSKEFLSMRATFSM